MIETDPGPGGPERAGPGPGAGARPRRPGPPLPRPLLACLPRWLRPSLGDLVLVALLRLVLAVPPLDTDMWWHLRTGEWILAEGRVPRVDVFSHTVAGQPWVAHGWLADVLMALAFRQAGLEAMAALQAALLTVALAVVLRHLRHVGTPVAAAVPLLFVTLILVLPAAHPRPYLVTLAFLALLLLWRRPGATGGRWIWAALPFLFALWANLHAGFVLGLAVLALLAAAAAWQERRLPWRPLGLLAVALAGCLVNPYGARLLAYAAQYRAGSAHYDLITEWASLDFHQPFSWLVLAFLALTALLLTHRRADGWRGDALLLGLFGALALTSVRNIPLLAVVATPVLARQIAAGAPAVTARARRDASAAAGVAAKLRRLAAADERDRGLPLAATALVLLALSVAGGPRDARASDPALWPRSAWWPLPYEAAAVLAASSGDGHGRLLNDYGWGGYLVWSLWPREHVFIDGRADVYGEQVMRQYADVVGLAPGWRAQLDARDVRRVLLPPRTPLVEALRLLPQWRVVHEDDVSVLLVR